MPPNMSTPLTVVQTHTPTLEDAYYPNGRTIASAMLDLVKGQPQGWLPAERDDLKQIEFKGPF